MLDFGIGGAGYAVFGEVVEGMDVVDRIAAVPTTSRGQHQNVPMMAVVIKKAREDLERAEQAIAVIEKTAKSVDKTSQSLDAAIGVQSQNLDALFNAMTRTTEDLQEVLQEIKSKPWSVVYRE
jgi:septal ring factor EnvC (AmiA/AmiB activator)